MAELLNEGGHQARGDSGTGQQDEPDDARSNLVLLEGLLNLFEVGEETDWKALPSEPRTFLLSSRREFVLTVGRDLVRGRSEGSKRSEDITVDLPRVGLTGDWVGVREAEELGDALVEGLNLLMVAVEESEERGLGAGRTLNATEANVLTGTGEVAEVPEKFLENRVEGRRGRV